MENKESLLVRDICDADKCPPRARAVVTLGQVLTYVERFEAAADGRERIAVLEYQA